MGGFDSAWFIGLGIAVLLTLISGVNMPPSWTLTCRWLAIVSFLIGIAGLIWRFHGTYELRLPWVRRGQQFVQELSKTPTDIRLQFTTGDNQPTCIEKQNIWRWYALSNGVVVMPMGKTGPDSPPQTILLWNIFLVFDRPVAASQIKVDTVGMAAPSFEIKDFGPRHAVVLFKGELRNLVVHIEVGFN
jgi:hypothetical protein